MSWCVGRTQGLTLIELLTVLTIVGLLLALAVPALNKNVSNAHTKSASIKIISLTQFARQHAVKKNIDVSLCPSVDGHYCAKNWQGSDIIVFEDADKDGQPDGGLVLTRMNLNAQHGYVVWQGGLNKDSRLTYTSKGWAKYNGRFAYCPRERQDRRNWRQIIVSRSGRARVAAPNEYKDYCVDFI